MDSKMEQAIVDCVRFSPGATFREIVDACGAEAQGDQELLLQENVVLWIDVSVAFCDAFRNVKDRLEPSTGESAMMCYLYDGATLELPVISDQTTELPTGLSWLPLIFSLREVVAAA